MSYQKTNWVDGFTPLSAEKMNNIEDGIFSNDNMISTLNNSVSNIDNSLTNYVHKSYITQSKNDNGYIKFKDGITIQWGKVRYDSNNQGWQKGYIRCRYPKRFDSEIFQIIATPYYSNGATDMSVTVQERNNEEFTIYIRNLDKDVPMVPVEVSFIVVGR